MLKILLANMFYVRFKRNGPLGGVLNLDVRVIYKHVLVVEENCII